MTAFERFAFPVAVTGEYPPVTVSFLVIAHNDAPVLAVVLKSVWREARATGGEVILADDGSTDGSDRICAAFARSYSRARVGGPGAGSAPVLAAGPEGRSGNQKRK
jgi:cellulose synthase/poly-beta-1,6-N-acetylglucosamine synthase-like glycosyltransferase